jgi:type IV pilus assembly protein PilC
MAKNPQTKLTVFVWSGKDRRGNLIKGETEGPNPAFVKSALRRQGISPNRIRRKPKPLFSVGSKIKPKDIAIATRQIATMIAAGIPIAQAYHAVARGHDNPKMQALFDSIRQEVESGTKLSTVLAKYPLHFDRLYQSLVAAGEESGTLDALLDKVATNMEKMEAIKSKVKSAMFYPIAIVIVAIVVVACLLIFVIPQFEDLFSSFGGQLPTLTQIIVNLSRWFQAQWYWAIGGAVGVILFIGFTYRRSTKLQFLMDRVVLKLPIFGTVIRKATVARFARTLATMFGAGVPLVDSLESVANATGNRVYYNGIIGIRNDVSTGRPLHASMTQTGIFPNMALQMVETGEESGELETMLDKVADFYEREVDDAVAAISSLIEPIMIVFLGVTVGTVVVAMYLPIFKMAAVF